MRARIEELRLLALPNTHYNRGRSPNVLCQQPKHHHQLQAQGVPYDLLNFTTESTLPSGAINRTLSASVPANLTTYLVDASGNPKYNALVFTSNGLGYGYFSSDGADQTWVATSLTAGMFYCARLTY